MKSLSKRSPRDVRQIELPIASAHANRKHFFDEKFFAVPGLVNSYWAGFIAADGCVHCNEHTDYISIVIQAADAHHVERFTQDAGYFGTGCIRIRDTNYIKKNGERSQVASMYIAAASWVADLERNYNITPRKSLTLQPPPNLDRACSLAYLAGLIDGDGSVRTAEASKGYPVLKVALCGGSRIILEWAAALIEDVVPGRGDSASAQVRVYPKRPTVFLFEVSGGRAARLAEVLLGLGVPLLDRKWGRVKAFIQQRYGDGGVIDLRTANTTADIQRIRERIAAGEDRKTIASEYGVKVSQVHRIASGKRWKHLADDNLKMPKAHKNPKMLAPETVQKIRAMLAQPEYQGRGSDGRIARQFGIRAPVVRDIRIGRTYGDIPRQIE